MSLCIIFCKFVFLIFCIPGYSETSVHNRISINSYETLSDSLTGIFGIRENASINASFAHARTPIPSINKTDTYYFGSLGMSYGADRAAFDIAVNYSNSPLAKLYTIGASLGFTYIHIPPSDEEKDFSDMSMRLLNHQFYPPGQSEMPLFWIRFGYMGDVLKSKALLAENSTGQQTAMTFDLSVPLLYTLVCSTGVGFFSYDDTNQFFSAATGQPSTLDHAFLGGTILGLPKLSVSNSVTWQIAPLDVFIPRYQGTMNSSSGLWSHTLAIAWRHLFFKKLYLTPSYELTYSPFGSAGGFSISFLYTL